MRARAMNTVAGESRLMDTEELRAYTNLGCNNAMKLGEEPRLIVADILPQGKDNTMGAGALCSRLGFESIRELQKEIARERAAGAVILSTCQEDGGYFLPRNVREVKEFIKTLENRGRNTLRVLESARELLRKWEDTGNI